LRTHAARIVDVLVVLGLFTAATVAVAGCDSDRTVSRDASPAPEPYVRAHQVADAWDGSPAAEAWAKGYYPMGETVQLPASAFRTDADKRAYAAHAFVLHGGLPAAPQKDGQVKWVRGGSLTLPLAGAREAYESMAGGSHEGPHLVVTGARLGEMALATSRGPATVPAWLFSLEGYDTPLRLTAVSPSKVPQPPITPAGELPTDDLAPLGGLVTVVGDGHFVTVLAHHGACDEGPAVDVLETDGSVVLSASVVGTKDGPCTQQLLGKEVTVRLQQPVGDRILLDAFTGRPVPNAQRPVSS
jgi:hypothetical protein